MARLVLINGAPATGKSTMARLYAERHPLTLALDLDLLRSMLGGWFDQPQQAGLITRAMALEAARVHLQAGRDVLVPQYLGRLEFVLQLEQLAQQTGAYLVEVALLATPDDVATRFSHRTAHPEDTTHTDAARLLQASGGSSELRAMDDRLHEVIARRPATITIDSTDQDIEETYAVVLTAIESTVNHQADDLS